MLSKDINHFWNWFDIIRGDLSIRQVEERAQCPRGRIGNARIKKRKPTYSLCKTIAAGLNIDIDEVLRQAGILRDEEYERMITESQDLGETRSPIGKILESRPEVVKLISLAHNLDDVRLRSVIEYTTWLSHLQRQEKKVTLKRVILAEETEKC